MGGRGCSHCLCSRGFPSSAPLACSPSPIFSTAGLGPPPLIWAAVTPHLGTCHPSSGRLLPFTWTVVTPRMGDYHCPAPGPCSSAAPKATCVCAPQGKSQTLPQASHSAWCSRLGALSVLFPSPECFSQFPLSLFSKAFWDIPPPVTSPGPTITWGPSLPLPWCPSGSTMIVGAPLCMG